jgi:hypothetical protein
VRDVFDAADVIEISDDLAGVVDACGVCPDLRIVLRIGNVEGGIAAAAVDEAIMEGGAAVEVRPDDLARVIDSGCYRCAPNDALGKGPRRAV